MDSGIIVATNKNNVSVGPDVYPEVKIISTMQPDMICFVFFLLKQCHIMTSQDGEQRMFLATLLTHSAVFSSLQLHLTNWDHALFHKPSHESEMKAFSRESSYLNSCDVADLGLVSFFP